MRTTDHILALDSGGSKTVVLLVRAEGTVVAVARGRGAAATTDIPGAALAALTPVVTEVLEALPADGHLVGSTPALAV